MLKLRVKRRVPRVRELRGALQQLEQGGKVESARIRPRKPRSRVLASPSTDVESALVDPCGAQQLIRTPNCAVAHPTGLHRIGSLGYLAVDWIGLDRQPEPGDWVGLGSLGGFYFSQDGGISWGGFHLS